MKFLLSLPLMAICVATAPFAFADEVVTGKIFDPETNKPLFLYENKKGAAGTGTFSQTRYRQLDGRTSAVEEDLLFENGKLRSYKYNQVQTGDNGTIDIKDGKISYRFSEEGKVDTGEEKFEEGMILPDQIESVIRNSWPQIMAGDSVKIRLLLLERQESVGFKLFKNGERQYKGKSAVDVTMKASSIIIAQIAPSFRITVEKEAPHRILETLGRLPIRMPKVNPPTKRDDWKAIDARLEMDPFVAAKAPKTRAPKKKAPKAPPGL